MKNATISSPAETDRFSSTTFTFPLIQSLVLFAITFSLYSCTGEYEFFSNELEELISDNNLSQSFANYEASFSAEKRRFDFTGPQGRYYDSIWVIMDGDKYVSLYFEQDKPYLDVFAANPDSAPAELIMPVRHHNATLLGTRITTSVWYDQWAISGDLHKVSISEGGEELTITESQKWLPDGKYKRRGESVYKMTFKVDPYLGYVVELECSLITNDSLKNSVEFINFMPPDVVNPWPGESQFPYTVYSSANDSGYEGFANNLYAGNLSDEMKTDWGKGFEVRNGGLIAMVEEGSWSPALFRKGDTRFVHRTCDAWLDQHNHILLPRRDEDGFFRMNPKFLFAYVPPTVSSFLVDQVQLNDFDRREETMIRLGVVEDFENQPLPLTSTQIGMTKGFWEEDFIISNDAYSGTKSLQINGSSKEELSRHLANFIRYPQIPLEPNMRYSISAFTKTSSDKVKAWISASTYEWTPHDADRLAIYSTDVASSTDWKMVELSFVTPDIDPMVDVRFMVEGEGYALFDDFKFVKTSN